MHMLEVMAYFAMSMEALLLFKNIGIGNKVLLKKHKHGLQNAKIDKTVKKCILQLLVAFFNIEFKKNQVYTHRFETERQLSHFIDIFINNNNNACAVQVLCEWQFVIYKSLAIFFFFHFLF